MQHRARPVALRRTTVLLGAVSLANLLALGASWWWPLDLLTHFVVVYLLIALGCLAWTGWRRQRRPAAWSLALVVIEVVRLWPLYGGAVDDQPGRAPLRVVSFNINTDNDALEEAAGHVAALEPDVVALFEVSSGQLRHFERALPDYAVRSLTRHDPFGIAVLCRLPLEVGVVESFGPRWVPAVRLRVLVDGHPVAFAAVHPPPPVTGSLAESRDRVLRSVATWAEQQPGAVVVVGDLNATPWSAIMREVLGETGLRTTQRFGVQPTWPAWLGSLGLPIDHALVAGPVDAVQRRVEGGFGSDHRMLIVDLALDDS